MKYNKDVQQFALFAMVLYVLALALFVLTMITKESVLMIVGWVLFFTATYISYIYVPNLQKEKPLKFSDYWKKFNLWLETTWKKFNTWLHT